MGKFIEVWNNINDPVDLTFFVFFSLLSIGVLLGFVLIGLAVLSSIFGGCDCGYQQ